MPALPLHEAGKYVAGAYVVAFALVLIYVAIMASRLSRIERELGELLAGTNESEPAERPGEQILTPDPEPDSLDLGRPESTRA
jgi:CcmD family protein